MAMSSDIVARRLLLAGIGVGVAVGALVGGITAYLDTRIISWPVAALIGAAGGAAVGSFAALAARSLIRFLIPESYSVPAGVAAISISQLLWALAYAMGSAATYLVTCALAFAFSAVLTSWVLTRRPISLR